MRCTNCGYEGGFIKNACPECHQKITLTGEDARRIKIELDNALQAKEYENAIEYYEILTACGDVESQREYAKLLEEGVLVGEDLVRAINLYKDAAMKNDAYSAFKYSNYVCRQSIAEGNFWLIYSAALGESEAYVPAAKELSRSGRESEANYFFSLASDSDHREATTTLAKRYYEGVGFESASPEYAKWYLKKFKFPPLYSTPMLLKLRKVAPKEPPRVNFDRDAFLRSLVKTSLDVGCESATLHLCEILGKRGDISALASAGMMKVQNIGSYGECEDGLRILRECAVRGSSDAYITLGDLYREGKYLSADINAAIFNYEMAAKMGRADALEALGDIFTDGKDVKRDFIKALEYYERADKLGSVKGERRSNEIRGERDRLYKSALSAPTDEEKFKLFAIACAMGHPLSATRLAECYEKGIGTRPESVSAFTWYLEATKRAEHSALVPLGRCYADGFGVNRNFKLALAALIKADRLADKRAAELITRIYEAKKRKIAKKIYSQAMRLVHIGKSDIAVELLALSEQLEYPKAIYSLGCLYEFGMGVPTDKDRAYDMYERAYKLKFRDPRAKFKLSILRIAKANLV